MSRVYFHTQHEGTAELRGSERAHMGCVVNDVALAFLPKQQDERIFSALRPKLRNQYTVETLRSGAPWPADWAPAVDMERLRLTLAVGIDRDPVFQRDGNPLATFALLLNTVLAIGNDSLCLFARLHGQCEVHCWVEGRCRAWMADLIDKGLASGVYRAGMGWDKVQALLRSGDEEPVVCSYSVTDGFPNPHIAGWEPPLLDDGEPDWEAWDQLSSDEQWRLCMDALRAGPARSDLRPGTLRIPYSHRLSLIDLLA